MALIAVDMDGTLLDPAGELMARTATALRAAAAAGYRVVLATGRPPHMITSLAAADEVIGSNADDGVAEYLEALLKSPSRHP